jgi:bacillithiol biosynthesis cysteine-adding enzyme BshC
MRSGVVLTLEVRLCNSTDPVPPSAASSSTSDRDAPLAIDLRRVPGVRRLAADYIYDFDRVAPFFVGNPADSSSWSRAIERARGVERNREDLVRVLLAQQDRRAAPEAAKTAARRLLGPATVAVVTGQQAGPFGGPLYTLLKAITAIQLARRLEAEHRAPAVPVFWIDAEDHDWNEVAGCVVLDTEFQPKTIRLRPPEHAGEIPVAAVRLDESIGATLRELGDALPQTEFTAELLQQLSSAYSPGRSMSEAFGRWIETLLGGHGLVVFDSADQAAKPLAASIFAGEIESAGTSSRLASEAGSRLAASGYHAQVSPQPETLALFQLDGRRLPIRLQDDALVVSGTSISRQEMLARAQNQPGAFSPNVLLRPVVRTSCSQRSPM